jgi:hypothetical protein
MAVYYPDFNSFRRAQRNALDKTNSYEAVMKRKGQSQAVQKMVTPAAPDPVLVTTLNGTQITTFGGSPLMELGA